jgi:hypothetical protein
MFIPPSGRSTSKRQWYTSACHARVRHPKDLSGYHHWPIASAEAFGGEMPKARLPASLLLMRSLISLRAEPSPR